MTLLRVRNAKTPYRKAMAKFVRRYKELLKPYWIQERNTKTGKKWKKRKEKPKRKTFHPLLKKTGRMQQSVRFRLVGEEMIAKMEDYGPFHEFGTVKMPARPWVSLSEDNFNFFVDLFMKEMFR